MNLRNFKLYTHLVSFKITNWVDDADGVRVPVNTYVDRKSIRVVASSEELARQLLRQRCQTHSEVVIELVGVEEAPMIMFEIPY